MLAPNVLMLQRPRLLQRKHHRVPGSISQALEHRSSLKVSALGLRTRWIVDSLGSMPRPRTERIRGALPITETEPRRRPTAIAANAHHQHRDGVVAADAGRFPFFVAGYLTANICGAMLAAVPFELPVNHGRANDERLEATNALLKRAELLNTASAEVHATYARAHESVAGQHAWKEATVRWRAARAAMYPDGFLADLRALRNGDLNTVDPALAFLERDPWCFRSGYVKADLMRYIARIELTAQQRERVELVLLHAVDAGDRREFGRACQLARRQVTNSLRNELKLRLKIRDRALHRRALQMLASLDDPQLAPNELEDAMRLVREEATADKTALHRSTARDVGDDPDWLSIADDRVWDMRRHRWVKLLEDKLQRLADAREQTTGP